MKIDKKKAQKKIIMLWLIGSLFLFLIFLYETVNTKDTTDLKDAWLWFMPNIISPLSLMIGVLIAESKKNNSIILMDKFFYLLSFYLSLFYLLLLLCTIIMHIFIDMKAIEFFRLSNLWLFPIQGLTVSSLGIFFVVNNKK